MSTVTRRCRTRPVLAVAIDGFGAHPGTVIGRAGADLDALDPRRLAALAARVEEAGADLVALHDTLDPPDPLVGELTGRPDAVLALAFVAAATSRIGLLATATVTHTEPFHVSKNVATLDHVSGGRGAWRVAVSTSPSAAARFGRRPAAPWGELVAEADEVIDVVRRLWDSWEDDAVIRDRSTGRYLDRDKVHYVDFEGRFFSVRGPSITPRPPQGQPLVAVDVTDQLTLDLAARRADVALLHVAGCDEASAARAALRDAAVAGGRDPDDVVALVVARVGEPDVRAVLDAAGGSVGGVGVDLTGPGAAVAAAIDGWWRDGAADGFLLLPDDLTHTVEWLARDVLAAFGPPPAGSLRDRLGLERPRNRYAAVAR